MQTRCWSVQSWGVESVKRFVKIPEVTATIWWLLVKDVEEYS